MFKKNKSLVQQLMKPPRKDNRKNMPVLDPDIQDNFTNQADLLFMPNDKGFRYALVVVDVGSRKVDAEPIKNKKNDTIVNAFKKIYKRNYLEFPKLLQVDAGNEFKGSVSKYFKNNGAGVRVGYPNRHRQQSLVESFNSVIAKLLFAEMNEKEIETGVTNTKWISNLPKAIKYINSFNRKKTKRRPQFNVRCSGKACDIVPKGTEVHVALDRPIDATGQLLGNTFRATDLRYEIAKRTIDDYVFLPYQPPLYKLSGLDDALYTRNQFILAK